MANIDLNAFKERVSVDGDKANVTVSPNKAEIDSPYRGSPSLVSQTSSYSLSSMMNFPNSYSKSQKSTPSRDYYSPSNTDLIYRCPVVECGKGKGF